jgi:hypothetical protein
VAQAQSAWLVGVRKGFGVVGELLVGHTSLVDAASEQRAWWWSATAGSPPGRTKLSDRKLSVTYLPGASALFTLGSMGWVDDRTGL